MSEAHDYRADPVPRAASCLRETPLFHRYCRHIGIRFNGRVMLRSVYNYDADAGWIETAVVNGRGHLVHEQGRLRLIRHYGMVEPYWR